MLHILWVIIKFIFILLGILLGLALLAVLLLLFCPVRYRAAASLEDEDWKEAEIKAGVSWLLHAVSLTVKKHGSETGFSIRLLGIPLDKLIFRKREKKDDKDSNRPQEEAVSMSEEHRVHEKKNAGHKPDSNQKAAIDRKPDTDQKPDTIQNPDITQKRDIPQKCGDDQKREGLISGIQGKLKEIPVKLKNISLTFRKIRDKIGWYQKLWNHPRTQEALSLVMKHARFLLKHILPTKIEGKVTFGFEDPAITGSILGVLGMTIPFHKNCIEVTPVFDGGNLLKGNIRLKGRIYGVVLVRAALVIYFNKNVKYVMKRWKHKEG